MEILKTIKERRSVRSFQDKEVDDDHIDSILEAARWAPSGLNNQPWRFKIIKDPKWSDSLAETTHYADIVRNAPVNVAVFYDPSAGYDRVKDLLALGACIQNMLLMIHELDLGAVWLGEILNQRKQAEEILNSPSDWELVSLVSIGHPTDEERSSTRRPLDDLIQ